MRILLMLKKVTPSLKERREDDHSQEFPQGRFAKAVKFNQLRNMKLIAFFTIIIVAIMASFVAVDAAAGPLLELCKDEPAHPIIEDLVLELTPPPYKQGQSLYLNASATLTKTFDSTIRAEMDMTYQSCESSKV